MTTTDCTDPKFNDFCNALCECYRNSDINQVDSNEGIPLSNISGNLYDSYGNRINKLKSIDGFRELVCWKLKSGIYIPPEDSEGPILNFDCEYQPVVNFCKALCICYKSLCITIINRDEEFDPEDKVIFDPEDKVIFDPEDKVIFDIGESFNPDDGIIFEHITSDLFDSYGNKININQSMDGFIKLICWLLKSEGLISDDE